MITTHATGTPEEVLRVARCVVLFGLLGCGSSTSSLPDTLRVLDDNVQDARCLVVFLPGAGDTAEKYFEHGFVSELRRARIRADVASVDAVQAYYRRGDVMERLREDVLAPARERYETLWLVGISMGGGGALRFAADHPELVDGVTVFAPFMGSRAWMRRIRSLGGASHFELDDETRTNPYGRAWYWVGHREAPLYVAWGAEDFLRDIAETMALELPASNVIRGGGGHEWLSWRDLWKGFIRGGALQRACGAPRGE